QDPHRAHLSAAVGAGALPGLVAAIGTRALAPPSLPRPPSRTPHDLTPKLRATFPSFVTRYRPGAKPITSISPSRISFLNTGALIERRSASSIPRKVRCSHNGPPSSHSIHCNASRIASVNSGTLCGTLRGDNPS